MKKPTQAAASGAIKPTTPPTGGKQPKQQSRAVKGQALAARAAATAARAPAVPTINAAKASSSTPKTPSAALDRELPKAIQEASAMAKRSAKTVADRWAKWQLGLNKTLSAYGVAIEDSETNAAGEVNFPAKAMLERDRFVHWYTQAVAEFNKSDLDHRTRQTKPWYETLNERCGKALQAIDEMEDIALKELDVVEDILLKHCG